MTTIKAKTFSGASKVHDGTLADAIRGVAQSLAAMNAATITDLTDSSGGTADTTIAAIGSFTPAVLGTTDAVAKAELEASLLEMVDGIAEIVAQVNNIQAVVPAFPALTDSMGGTAADGTIALFNVAHTGQGASNASATGANTALDAIKIALSQAAYWVNRVCTACGVAGLTDSSGVVGDDRVFDAVFAAISLDTGTAVSGADLTAANATVLATDADAINGLVADAVADMAARLNACTAAANANPIPTVFAG